MFISKLNCELKTIAAENQTFNVAAGMRRLWLVFI